MPKFNPLVMADWKREGVPFGVGYLGCCAVLRFIVDCKAFVAGIDKAEREHSNEGEGDGGARPMPPACEGRYDGV